MIDDKDINIDRIVKAAKLLTVWSRITKYTVSVQKNLYDELQMKVTPLIVGANSESGLVELVVLPRLKAIADLKGRFRLFEQTDYEPVLRRDTTRVETQQ
jgi:hypothetical protein